MKKIKAFLFDMDGVITDTEGQYDVFLGKLQEEYHLVSDFVQKIKGTTLEDMISRYFSHLEKKEQEKVADRVLNFELNEMKYDSIPGAVDFVKEAKRSGVKIALITSSLKIKVEAALKYLKLETTFDALITADDVIIGKPDPQCYLLGAERLKVFPEECLVFEDSFAGMESGKRAGMKVIGLSTTHSKESLQGKADQIIPDFLNFKPGDFKSY